MQDISAPNILGRQPKRAKAKQGMWVALGVMFVLAFAVSYALVIRVGSDLGIHTDWALEGDFLNPRTFFRHGAHPMWHMMVALIALTGMPVKLSAALITALLKTAGLRLIHRLMTAYWGERFNAWRIILAAFACAMVSALCLPPINPAVYIGVGSPNPWHSPTQMIVLVFMFLCVPYTAYCYAEFQRRLPQEGRGVSLPRKQAALLSALLVLSLAAKPTFMQTFLPAACLYFLGQWIRHPRNSRYFGQMILAVLPAVLLMVLQYLYYFGVIVPSQGNMILDAAWVKVWPRLRAVLLVEAFPLYVLALCLFKGLWKNLWKDPLMALTLLMNAVGVLEYLILGEDGRRASDGNFGWGMMGAALMFWVMMMIRFHSLWAEEKAKRGSGQPGIGVASAYVAGTVLLLWHAASGMYYVGFLLSTQNLL